LFRGLRSADHEYLLPEETVEVGPDRAAGARRGARHRGDSSFPALVEGAGAGHLDGLPPDAAGLADHERLLMAGAVVDRREAWESLT